MHAGRWFTKLELCAGIALALFQGVVGCRRHADSTAGPPARAEPRGDASVKFASRPIGQPAEGQPWITDLAIADLDRDGRLDVIACEGRLNQVVWVRQTGTLTFTEEAIGGPVAGPAHVEVVDLDADGDHDVLVASMGKVLPNNERIGAVVVLENDGRQVFSQRVLVDDTYRVTDVRAADLDGDGDLDLSVGQFGYLEGQVQWMENRGAWNFVGHPLLALSGCVHAPVVDLNGDRHPDIVALITQDWEEVHAFENHGGGRFTSRVLHGSTNKDFGSSGLTVGDVDRDGDDDIIYANGDAFDYATPGARPWHGVQWLENQPGGRFVFRRLGGLPGAYSPLVIDLDADGDRDVVAVSGFNDWSRGGAIALGWFENDGKQQFALHSLAGAPTHLVVVDGADLDGDGDVELVTGGFYFYPPFDRVSRVTLWERAAR